MARLILALISLAAGASGMGTYETCTITSTDGGGAFTGCTDGVFIGGTCADGKLCDSPETDHLPENLRCLCLCCQGEGEGSMTRGTSTFAVPNYDALVPPS